MRVLGASGARECFNLMLHCESQRKFVRCSMTASRAPLGGITRRSRIVYLNERMVDPTWD